MKRQTCIVYQRVSTKEQDVELQTRVCEELVLRHNLEVLDVVKDPAISGTLLKGRKLLHTLNQIGNGSLTVDYIVVAEYERLFREDRSTTKLNTEEGRAHVEQSMVDAAIIQSRLLTHGVKVIDKKHGVIDPQNTLVAKMIEGMTYNDLSNIRERSDRGKEAACLEHKKMIWAHIPYGYVRFYTGEGRLRKRSSTVMADPITSEHLRRVLSWYADGGYAYAAKKATEEGVPTPHGVKSQKPRKDCTHVDPNRGKWWRAVIVQLVKRADSYLTGQWHYQWKKTPFSVECPALIDADLYNRVKSKAHIFEQNSKGKVRKQYSLTGRIKCSCKGPVLMAVTQYNRINLACPRCNRAMVYDSQWWWDAARTRLLQIGLSKPEDNSDPYTEQVRAKEQQIAKIAQLVSNLMRMCEDDTDGMAGQFRARMKERTDEKRGCERDLEALRVLQLAHRTDSEKQKYLGYKALDILRGCDKNASESAKRVVLRDLLGSGRIVVKYLEKTLGKRNCLQSHIEVTFPRHGTLDELVLTDKEDPFSTAFPDGFAGESAIYEIDGVIFNLQAHRDVGNSLGDFRIVESKSEYEN